MIEDENEIANSDLIFDNAKLSITPTFLATEIDRLDQVKKLIPDFDKFNLTLLDEELPCSLKYIA